MMSQIQFPVAVTECQNSIPEGANQPLLQVPSNQEPRHLCTYVYEDVGCNVGKATELQVVSIGSDSSFLTKYL